jgi:hypothetical protein
MSNIDLSSRQLFDQAKAAVREKNMERAKPLFAELAARSLAEVRAKVANDIV